MLALVLLSLFGTQSWATRQAAAQTAPAAQYAVYLPLVSNAGSAPTNPGGPDGPGNPNDPGAPASNGAFFFNREAKNNSADIETDAAGGIHAAYAYFTPEAEHPPAVYTYCP